MPVPAATTAKVPSLLPEKIKKGIKNEQHTFREMLQREAQKKLQEEAKRRRLSQQIKKRLENASKRVEKESKKVLLSKSEVPDNKSPSTNLRKKSTKNTTADPDAIFKEHELLREKQLADLEQKAVKKAMLESEKLGKYQQREEEYRRKIKAIKRQKSVALKEEQQKRLELLQKMDRECTNF